MANRINSALLALALLAAVAAPADTPSLTPEEYWQAKQSAPYFFAVFHPKDCPYCDYLKQTLDAVKKDLGPEAAGVTFGLVDVGTHTGVGEAEKIRETPLVKFFARGHYYTYYMDRLGHQNVAAFLRGLLGHGKTATFVDSERAFVAFNDLDYSVTLSFPEVAPEQHALMADLQHLYPSLPVFYTQSDSKFHKRIFTLIAVELAHHHGPNLTSYIRGINLP